ncbi:MAG: peptidase T [Eubacteriales bacterium]
MKKILERFLEYVKIDTQSEENSSVVPSSKGQFKLAEKLIFELDSIGIKAEMDEHACVTAKIPANVEKSESGEKIPSIGFLAHLDTSPDCSGHDVKPKIHENYDGKSKIIINEELGKFVSPDTNRILSCYEGNTIITSDGTTLLGADDKAGIASIMTMLEYIQANPDFKHGEICIAFTPDEEVQGGMSVFDIKAFGADFAFTVDGGGVGEFNHETFNAAGATVKFKGICIHPGAAKDKLINPVILLSEFVSMLPKNELPETTQDREGFYYPYEAVANEEEAKLEFLLRDFDAANIENRKAVLKDITDKLNEKWGGDYVSLETEYQYSNMNDYFKGSEHIIENAIRAYKECGINNPDIVAIRGGTDGSHLSKNGLPTPNIFTGGHNFHSATEFCSVEGMEWSSKILLKILEIYANR